MWRWVCAVALLLGALSNAREPQRAEVAAASPFVLSSRYGRSAPRLMSPRNDRFFMSSRYGKRGMSSEANAGGAGAARGSRCDCRHCGCRPYDCRPALRARYFGRPAAGGILRQD